MIRWDRSVRVRVPVANLYSWHLRPGAFERLAPPWTGVEATDRTGGVEDGARITVRSGGGPLPWRWTVVHREVLAGRGLRDVQERGPFAAWSHTHAMGPDGAEASRPTDAIEAELPGGRVAEVAAGSILRDALDRLFIHRHRASRTPCVIRSAGRRMPGPEAGEVPET